MATKKTIHAETARLEKEIASLEERKKEIEKHLFTIIEQAQQPA